MIAASAWAPMPLRDGALRSWPGSASVGGSLTSRARPPWSPPRPRASAGQLRWASPAGGSVVLAGQRADQGRLVDARRGAGVRRPGLRPTGYEPAALVTPGGRDVITTEVRNVRTWNGRFNVTAKIVEVSASTDRTLRVLYTTAVDHATGGDNGEVARLDQQCRVLSLGPDASDPLVDCFSVGALVHGKLITLPGFPSPTSSGISGQNAIAW